MSDQDSTTTLHSQFITAWHGMTDAADACRLSILRDAPLPCWIWQSSDPLQARTLGGDILTQFLYVDDQAPRESIICPGVLAAGDETLRLANILNARKDRVRELLQAMDKVRVSRPSTVPDHPPRTQTLTEYVLAHEGLKRLHRMQVYRHLRLMHRRPARIAFGWARTRRVRRRSAKDIQTILEQRLPRAPYPDLIVSDITRLGYIGPGEMLALVDQEPPHVRANLAWRRENEPGWERKQMTVALPLLFPARSGDPFPALKPLRAFDEGEARRQRRAGRVLESEPFLRTLPAYRYREGHRGERRRKREAPSDPA